MMGKCVANPKAVVCIETGEVFLSQKEAAERKDIYSLQHICSCCKGKLKTCGGYHWRYASKEETEKALSNLQASYEQVKEGGQG